MINYLTSERVKWYVTTFIAILAAIWLIENNCGLKDSLRLLIVNFVLSFIILLVIIYIINYPKRKFEKFMKLSKGDTISLVVPAYQDTRKYDRSKLDEENYRYFKVQDGIERRLVGAHKYLTGIGTATTVAEFSYKLRELTSNNIDLVRDDETINKDGPLICFGSPNSNLLSEKYLRPNVCQFKGPNELECPSVHRETYKASEKHDYGVLFRENYICKSGKKSWAFICAGIDEEATIASSFYLLNNWKKLDKYKGVFIHIIECDKREPFKSQKKAGGYFDDLGAWVAD